MSHPRAAERLLQAACLQFVTVGADRLTMEGIAERAGVSIGAAYRWQPSLENAAYEVLRAGLPVIAEEIASAGSLDGWLQPATAGDRLLTESLLAVRRFPSVATLVEGAIATVASRVRPLGLSLVIGSQAMMIGGCIIPAQGRFVIARLYERICAASPAGPLPWAAPAIDDFAATVAGPAQMSAADLIGERLIAATASVLASRQEATVRSIAESAGVTTGAIYRRYESKDQLVADTIRAHLTADRTTWAIPFVARLAGAQAGDPAEVLAEQLALAGDRDAELTRLSVEFIVASRLSPDSRQVLVQRITEAQQARQSLFEAMRQAGIFSRDDTPLALSWALQVTPTGARLLSLVGPQPSAEQWRSAMSSLLRSL